MLAQALTQAGQWQRAEEVITSIQDRDRKTESLRELAQALVAANNYEQLLRVVQRFWQRAGTRDEALSWFSSAHGLIHLQPEIGTSFYEVFAWIDAFLKG